VAGTAEVTLTAVGSGRQISLAAPGTPLLLICFAQETQSAFEPVEAAARARYPDATDLVVGHLVDLHKVPSLLRKVAEGVLGSEHRRAVDALQPGQAPDDYVVILPDWDGSTVRSLGLDDVTKTLGIVLIHEDGRILWRYQDAAPAETLSERLEQPLNEGPRL
jgi:hypothetical protein